MWYVYILQFENWKYYIWSTNNLERRLYEHRTWHTLSIRSLWTFVLVKSFVFDAIVDARKVEYYIKKQKSKKIIDHIVSWTIDIYCYGPLA